MTNVRRAQSRRAQSRRMRLATAVTLALLGGTIAPAAVGQERGYELVSPADDRPYRVDPAWKSTEPNTSAASAQRVTPDGGHASFQIGATLPGMTPDGESDDHLVASRGARGWDWKAPLADRTGIGCGFGDGIRFDTISDDGGFMALAPLCAKDKPRLGGVDPATGEPLDQTGRSYTQYGADVETDEAVFIGGRFGTDGPLPRTGTQTDSFFGGSPDLGTVYFGSPASLLPEANDTSITQQYVYRRSGGVTSLVTRTPSGAGFQNATGTNRRNTVSADGGAITLAAPGTDAMVAEDTNTVADVYQDRNGLVTWISDRAEVADPPATAQTPAARMFEGASADGDHVYFSTAERFTADDTDSVADIYVYDFDEPEGARISRVSRQDGGACAGCDDNGSSTAGLTQSVAKFVAASDDGTRVFFISGDILSEDDGDAQPSLYVRDVTAGTTGYVAPVGAGVTSASNGADAGTGVNGSLAHANEPSTRQIVVAGDGAVAAFSLATNVPLPLGRGGPDADGLRDLFVWRDGDGLRRVRQGPGTDDNTTTVPGLGCYLGRSAGRIDRPRCRSMAADAETVFFETPDALVAEDTDPGSTQQDFGVPRGYDVYAVDTRDGSVALVSPPGDAALPSRYLDASASGDSVFFLTKETLDPSRDTDLGHDDLYAARTGTVFGPLPEPPPGCAGDACQPAGPAAPGAPPVQSGGTVDSDNVAPRERIRRSLQVSRPNRRAVRRLAQTGRLPLRVRLAGGGTIRVGARARVRVRVGGRIGVRSRRVAQVRRRVAVSQAREVRVVVRLSRKARRQLRRNGRLGVQIRVRVSGLGTRSMRVVPRRAAKRSERRSARRSSHHYNRPRG